MDTEQNARNRSCLTVSEEDKEYRKDSCKQFTSEVIEEYNNTVLTGLSENKLNTLQSYFNEDNITPDSLFHPEVYKRLCEEFPEPFDKYSTHLPKRTPFSVLLDIMNLKYDTKEQVMEELRRFLGKLKFPEKLDRPGNKNQHLHTMESTVICVCYNKQSSFKYFGASMGCRTKPARKIMINSSCINTWHDYMSYVVMSYRALSTEKGKHNPSLPCLVLPESMKCKAYLRDFTRNTYREIPPCSNCQRMFSLGNQIGTSGPYGNCAETECLSKVLYDDQLRGNIQIKGYDGDKMEELKKDTKGYLKSDLCSISTFKSMFNRMGKKRSLPVFNP